MHMQYYFNQLFGVGFGSLAMLLFWLLVILLIVWVLREAAGGPYYYRGRRTFRDGYRNNYRGTSDSRALDILKERYARGEITRADYDQMRRDILADSRREREPMDDDLR